jgi:hypothetical protein
LRSFQTTKTVGIERSGQEIAFAALEACVDVGNPGGVDPRTAGLLGLGGWAHRRSLGTRGRLVDVLDQRPALRTGVALSDLEAVNAAGRAPWAPEGEEWAVVAVVGARAKGRPLASVAAAGVEVCGPDVRSADLAGSAGHYLSLRA